MNKAPRVVKQTSEGHLIIKSSTVHGTSQMRCPRCPGMCALIKDAAGKELLICSSCKAKFSARRL
jgi:uncharacterized C2H2 Zn-finger protein